MKIKKYSKLKKGDPLIKALSEWRKLPTKGANLIILTKPGESVDDVINKISKKMGKQIKSGTFKNENKKFNNK